MYKIAAVLQLLQYLHCVSHKLNLQCMSCVDCKQIKVYYTLHRASLPSQTQNGEAIRRAMLDSHPACQSKVFVYVTTVVGYLAY